MDKTDAIKLNGTMSWKYWRGSHFTFTINGQVVSEEKTTLHHITLHVVLEGFESEKMRFEGFGLKVDATVHEWLHVRSLYFPNPEGNSLEFVSYDESVR